MSGRTADERAWQPADFAALCAATLVPAAVYLRTMAPAVYFGDSGELNVAAFGLGIAHVPGYPLYCTIGKLATMLPLGSVAFRMNLLSVVSSVAALGLLFVLTRRLAGFRWAALTAALVFAFTFTLWEQSLKSRAYPLNLLLGVAVLYCFVRWHDEGEGRWAAVGALLFGVGLGNHEILLVTAMPIAALAVSRWRSLNARLAIGSALAFLLGLSVYLHLPLRSLADPMLDWGDPETLSRLIDVLLQRQYSHKILSPDLGPKIEMAALIGKSFAVEFTWLPLALAAAGAVSMWRRQRALLIGLVLMVLANVALRVNYIGDFEFFQIYRYLVNSYAVVAILLAFGLTSVFAFLQNRLRAQAACLSTALIGLAAVALPFANHVRSNDLSNHWLARDYARSILQTPDQEALLFVGGDNDIYPLWDQQWIARYREDTVTMGKAGFWADWLRDMWGEQTDPAFFEVPPGLIDYDGPNPIFHFFFENAVESGRYPVYAMYNDAEDPVESRRWARIRETYAWEPRGLSIAFATKENAALPGSAHEPFDWEALPLDSLLDPDLVRDAHTREVIDVCLGIFLKHGLLALSEGRIADANRQFARILIVDPDHYEAAMNLASGLGRAGRPRDAIAILEEHIGDPRADWRLWFNLGVIRGATGDAAGASKALTKALSMNPDESAIREQLDALPQSEKTGADAD